MPMPRRLRVLSLFAALLLLPATVRAQDEFGLNKIQYGTHTWYYVSTRHFNIYFTPQAALVGQYAAGHVEAMYDTVSRILGFPMKDRVPIILYSTPAEFQQTNIIPQILPEGVGGFTEIFRNRVVIPFEGSYTDFHHVLQHEMTHAFMFDRENTLGSKFSTAAQEIPLWFGEGLAEYASLGWDLNSEFFMLDAVLFGYVGNPGQDGLPGFLAYKGGQLFYYYLVQTFGPTLVREWIGQVAKGKNPQMAFRELAHVSLTEVGDVWLREIRSIYWPELRERRYGKSIARQLTDHTQDQSNINMQPVLSPDGSKIAFFSDREPNVGLHIIDVEAEKVGKALSSAGSVKGHLSFYPYQSRITWSPDGTRLAFVSKTGDRDIISIINAKNGKSFDDVSPPDIRGILSPDWSPDGKTLVFNGIKDGRSDIFLWDLEKKKLSQLTNDIAVDQNPVFSPSGEWIAFDSDRNRPDLPQDSKRPFMALKMLGPMHDIYKIRTKGGTPIRILGGQFDERSPSYGPSDTEMVFLSNRSGISNIYIGTASDSGDWKSVPITNLTGSCYSPSWSRSGDRVAFSLFEDRGWDVYMMSSPKSHIISDSLPKTRFIRKIENPEMRFFNPLTVKNLSTFAKQRARSDSLRMSRTKAGRDSIAKKDSLIAKDSTLKRDTIALNPPPEPVTSSASLAPKPVPGIVDSASMKDSAALVNGTRKPSASDSGKPDSLASRSERLYSEWADTGQVDLSGETPRLGAFLAKPYKPKWGLEVAAADLGYNTFSRGLAGQTYLTVSDLLGNHRISFMISSGGTSLKSINGLINYDLLSYRTDYGFTAFNFANYQAVEGGFYYFDREYGGSVSARYPVSQFTRFQADINGFATERRLYDAIYGNMVPDSIFAPENLAFVQPSVSWIHDNAEYGIVGPLLGRRMKATISYVPPLFTDSISFIQADADFRKYWLFSKAFSLVARAAVGASEAVGGKTNPQLYLGGGDDLIPFVARTKPGNEPVTLPEVVFSQLAVPVRGFRFYEFRGNRKFISNLEFRFPFVETFRVVWPLPITLRYLMGTLFFDYGGAWQSPTNDNEFQAAIDGLGMGYGYGLRLNLGVFVLRYTNAWTVADVGPGRGGSRSYWSIGGEF